MDDQTISTFIGNIIKGHFYIKLTRKTPKNIKLTLKTPKTWQETLDRSREFTKKQVKGISQRLKTKAATTVDNMCQAIRPEEIPGKHIRNVKNAVLIPGMKHEKLS